MQSDKSLKKYQISVNEFQSTCDSSSNALSQPFTVRDFHHSLAVKPELLLPLPRSNGTEEARWCGEVGRPSTHDGERLLVEGGP